MNIILIMIFLHIVDDYYLQGWLASAKQKKWWVANAPQMLYRYDYVWVLIMHSFSWAFMIMLPIMYVANFHPEPMFYFVFFINVLIHGLADHLKANCGKINLIQDQTIHILQIIATWLILIASK